MPPGVVDAADYNSSDDEVEVVENPFINAGKKSIGKLLANPAARQESKAFVKTLQQGGSWHARYASALWYNRFEAFRTFILRKE